jgi:hypothetical protein
MIIFTILNMIGAVAKFRAAAVAQTPRRVTP